MLKLASLDDYDRVEELILKFFRAGNFTYGEIELDKIRALFHNAADSFNPDSIAILWIEDGEAQGLIVGYCTEVIFNRNRVATELAWWVEPAYRKGEAGTSLLGAFEHWAGLRNCKFVQMIGLQNEYAPVLDRYYKQKGYSPAENSYVKEI
jgi:RimJ/RimL family protein N-acetyltransferase